MIRKSELKELLLNNSRRIDELKRELELTEKKYAELLTKSPASTQEFANRLADLEVKMGKLWALLLEQDKRGNDKLSKFGRRFGGQAKKFARE